MLSWRVTMKFLLYLIIATAFLSQFRDIQNVLGPTHFILALLPETASGFLLILLLFAIGRRNAMALSPKYIIVGVILVLHISLGGILNAISPGAFVGGIRVYFAFLPLFILPAVYEFSERETRSFLKFVLAFALLQVPVSVYQRIFVYPITPTGDVVRGMFPSGAIMSTFLIAVIAILMAMYLRGHLSRPKLFGLCCLLPIPMLINETKASVVLLPVALIGVAIFFRQSAARWRVITKTLGLCVAFVVIFGVAYDHYFAKPGERMALLKYFSEDALRDLQKDELQGNPRTVGRLDSIENAYDFLDEDFTKLAFGLGIGNVTNPDTISVIEGEYSDQYEDYGAATTTYSFLLWEIGSIGVFITLLIVALLLMDAKRAAVGESFASSLALGWCGVLIMFPLAFLYKDLVHCNVVVALTMYVSGLMACSSYRTSISSNQTTEASFHNYHRATR